MVGLAGQLQAAGEDVWDGITPSFGPFSGLLESKVGIFLALAWMIGFIYVAYHLMEAIARMVRARRGGYGDDMSETKRDLLLSAASAIALAALPAIWVILVGDV